MIKALNCLYCDDNSPKLVVHYGSRLKNSDIDLLVVLDKKPFTNYFVVGNYDIFQFDEQHIDDLIRLLDPLITEPLLTGKPLPNYFEAFNKYSKTLKSVNPSGDTISHLLRSGIREFNNALQFSLMINDQCDFFVFVNALSFAISYLAFARHYLSNPKLATLEELSKQSTALKWIQNLKKEIKKGKVEMSFDLKKECIQRTERFFVGKEQSR